jgi:hypothetical protein
MPRCWSFVVDVVWYVCVPSRWVSMHRQVAPQHGKQRRDGRTGGSDLALDLAEALGEDVDQEVEHVALAPPRRDVAALLMCVCVCVCVCCVVTVDERA